MTADSSLRIEGIGFPNRYKRFKRFNRFTRFSLVESRLSLILPISTRRTYHLNIGKSGEIANTRPKFPIKAGFPNSSSHSLTSLADTLPRTMT